MQYNIIHKEYRLGLGLWFKLVYDHISHPGQWLALSNIPAIHHLKLQATDKEHAVAQVWAKILKEFEL